MQKKGKFCKPVVLCIGTTGVVGDSLGPKVGDRLVTEYNINAYVYGKSAKPVTGINYGEYVKHIHTHHKGSVVIAVDACLGKFSDVGKIKYCLTGLNAGSALNKDLGRVGDVGILGIVGESGNNNLDALMSVAEERVEEIADRVAKKILNLVDNLRLYYNFRHTI